jgi:hypothetical protein
VTWDGYTVPEQNPLPSKPWQPSALGAIMRRRGRGAKDFFRLLGVASMEYIRERHARYGGHQGKWLQLTGGG